MTEQRRRLGGRGRPPLHELLSFPSGVAWDYYTD